MKQEVIDYQLIITYRTGHTGKSEAARLEEKKGELEHLLRELEERKYVNTAKYNLSLLSGMDGLVEPVVEQSCEFCDEEILPHIECHCTKCGRRICRLCEEPGFQCLHCWEKEVED